MVDLLKPLFLWVRKNSHCIECIQITTHNTGALVCPRYRQDDMFNAAMLFKSITNTLVLPYNLTPSLQSV